MPTSLTYISLSTRGSLPWRPAADMGTNRRDTSTWPSPGFSRSEGKIRTPPQLRCSSRSKPYLPARGFQGTRTLIQKRKLFPDLPTASPGHFGLPRRTLFRGPELYAVPLPGSGIGTGFPFARRACAIYLFPTCLTRARVFLRESPIIRPAAARDIARRLMRTPGGHARAAYVFVSTEAVRRH